MLAFTIPGHPVPKARARVVNGNAYTPEKTRKYERLIGIVASASVLTNRACWSTAGRYRVEMTVTPADNRRFDLDNVVKSVLDGCNGVVWDDDCQVDEIHVTRLGPDRVCPGVKVVIVPIETPSRDDIPAASTYTDR